MQELHLFPEQAAVCKRYDVQPQIPLHHDRLGIAMSTLGLKPINGMRIPAFSGSSGWYIFGGEEPNANEDFYSPLCVRHVGRHCKNAVPYLCLPAGWRFQIDADEYEDVWYGERLLSPTER